MLAFCVHEEYNNIYFFSLIALFWAPRAERQRDDLRANCQSRRICMQSRLKSVIISTWASTCFFAGNVRNRHDASTLTLNAMACDESSFWGFPFVVYCTASVRCTSVFVSYPRRQIFAWVAMARIAVTYSLELSIGAEWRCSSCHSELYWHTQKPPTMQHIPTKRAPKVFKKLRLFLKTYFLYKCNRLKSAAKQQEYVL